MPSIDDQLKDRMRDAASWPAGADDLFVRIGARKRRRAVTRKVGTVGLVVAVLVGTVGGFAVLGHAFRTSPSPASAPKPGNGDLVVSIRNEDSFNLMVLPADRQDLDPSDGITMADRDAMSFLTSEPGTRDVDPAVSPDGSTVAFVRQDSKDALGALWLIGIDGTNERPVTRAPADVRAPAWSPDGSSIAFSAADEPEGRALYTIRPDGSDLRVLARSQDVGASAWSPDGSRVVFSAAPSGDVLGDLWVVAPDGSGLVNLTQTPDVNEIQPAWSTDGTAIAFATPDGIEQLPATGGASQVLVPTSPLGEGRLPTRPAWSPDGSYLTFVLAAPAPLASTVYVLPGGSSDAFPLALGSSFGWQPVPPPSSSGPLTIAIENLGVGLRICDVMSMPITVAGTSGDAYVFSEYAAGCPKPGDGRRFVAADLDGDGIVDTEPILLGGCFPPVGCETFAAPDVNGDGTSEIAVSEAGADGYGVRLFAVTTSPPSIEPIDVVDPQGIGDLQTGELQFAWVDVAGHSEGARCDAPPNGTTFTVFGVDKLDRNADVRSTVLRIDGATGTVVGASREKVALADAPVPGNLLCGAPLYGSASAFPEAAAETVCDVTTVIGDVDGDGHRDSVTIGTERGRSSDCPYPGQRTLAIDLGNDGSVDIERSPPDCSTWCVPFAVVDVDRDGTGEIFLNEGHLAPPASAVIAVYVLRDGTLVPVVFPDGENKFPIQNSWQGYYGAYCTPSDGTITLWEGPTDAGGGQLRKLIERKYRIDDSGVRFLLVGSHETLAPDAVPPRDTGYDESFCGTPATAPG